jgi:phosphoglycolate phosphatase-like HAD superfamily hydrolase
MKDTKRRLILWDIDGTLVWTGPATRGAFDRAVSSVLGEAIGDHGVSLGGKTDPQIAMEIFAALAVEEADARRYLPDVMAGIERELAAAVDALRDEGTVLPGVQQLVERLASRPDVIQTVLTGNTQVNGRLKLAAFGLDRYLNLDIGAYGSDSADRRDLVPVALEKLRRLRGVTIGPGDTWVIGDTALDLACARAGGTRCLLVATGRISLDELAMAGAEATMADLSDVEAVERLFLGEDVTTPA